MFTFLTAARNFEATHFWVATFGTFLPKLAKTFQRATKVLRDSRDFPDVNKPVSLESASRTQIALVCDKQM